MDIKTFSSNLTRLCDMLEAAILQAVTLQEAAEDDGTLYEVREKIDGVCEAIRDAAYRAYDVNNDVIYIAARDEAI